MDIEGEENEKHIFLLYTLKLFELYKISFKKSTEIREQLIAPQQLSYLCHPPDQHVMKIFPDGGIVLVKDSLEEGAL